MQVKSKWRGKPRDWKGLRRHKPRVKGETACAGCLQQHWRRFLSEMTKDMQTGTSRSMTFRNLGYFSGEIMWFFFSPKGFPIFLEKEMAIHSSTLAWKIPWTEEPDRLQSMGSQKSRTPLSNFTHSLCSLKTLPLSVERSSLFLFSQKSGRFWWLP